MQEIKISVRGKDAEQLLAIAQQKGITVEQLIARFLPVACDVEAKPRDISCDISCCFRGQNAEELRAIARQASMPVEVFVERSLEWGRFISKEMSKGNKIAVVNKRGRIIKEVSEF